eukprot:gb/GEZN01011237.1/.p1 GENE.gb/GEZN01011237.1/~~gb/GEZN01011237.1/.p1  ORF type:complete len:325 (+),score=28.32 gb/GEZN01011237.1/:53-1027(+)
MLLSGQQGRALETLKLLQQQIEALESENKDLRSQLQTFTNFNDPIYDVAVRELIALCTPLQIVVIHCIIKYLSNPLPQEQIIGDWPLDRIVHGRAHDSSGNDRHGILQGDAQFVPGPFGPALSFDGTYDVTLPVDQGADTFTVSLWAKAAQPIRLDEEFMPHDIANGCSDQHYVVWNGGAYPGSDAGALVSLGTNGVAVYEHAGGYMPAVAVYRAALGSSWVQVVVTYSHKVPRIFVNGKLVREGKISPRSRVLAFATGGCHETGLKLGASSARYGPFTGAICRVRLLRVALSERQVAAAYDDDAESVSSEDFSKKKVEEPSSD